MTGAIGVLWVGDWNAGGAASTFRTSDRFDVVATAGADGCLARLDDGKSAVDCVVSRYDLPESDGLELLAAVRERDARLPVVLYADTCETGVVSEAASRGSCATSPTARDASGRSDASATGT